MIVSFPLHVRAVTTARRPNIICVIVQVFLSIALDTVRLTSAADCLHYYWNLNICFLDVVDFVSNEMLRLVLGTRLLWM